MIYRLLFELLCYLYLSNALVNRSERLCGPNKVMLADTCNTYAGPYLERARVLEALCFTVGHAVFADGVPDWHSLIKADQLNFIMVNNFHLITLFLSLFLGGGKVYFTLVFYNH